MVRLYSVRGDGAPFRNSGAPPPGPICQAVYRGKRRLFDGLKRKMKFDGKFLKEGLTFLIDQAIIIKRQKLAGVAQLVEQLICNQQVRGSSPFTSSKPGGPAR